MKFPYVPYQVEPTPSQPGVTTIFRPLIPFRVFGPTDNAVFYGLVDTGADETILPRALADLLSVPIEPIGSAIMISAGGEITIGYGHVAFELKQGRTRCRWAATVGIIDQPWQEAILGHACFLQYFDITFQGEKKHVLFKRNQLPLPG